MPCYDPTIIEESNQAHKSCHILTAMLCKMCRQANKANLELPPDVQEWWDKHKIIDDFRQQETITPAEFDIVDLSGILGFPRIEVSHPIAGLVAVFATFEPKDFNAIKGYFAAWKRDPINNRFGKL